jgi:hypothetical protein
MNAPQKTARLAKPLRLPSGEGDNKRAQISPDFNTPIVAVKQGPEGSIIEFTLGELPKGTTELYVQYRQCGDFYCFIKGTKQVSAIGSTRADAFKNALKLAA